MIHVFNIMIHVKGPLYPKYVATISGLFKLQMIVKSYVHWKNMVGIEPTTSRYVVLQLSENISCSLITVNGSSFEGRIYTCLKIMRRNNIIINIGKGLGPTMLDRLPATTYSQTLSHYCLTGGLLPAMFPSWASATLLRQPGGPGLPRTHHIDARLSMDARST